MALAQLAWSLARALARMAYAPVVDDKVLGDCLNDVARALLQADVRFDTVRAAQASIRSAAAAAGTYRRRAIMQAVEAELRRMLDPAGARGAKPSSFAPTRGKKPASVVMLVGLQGSGKTTTCVKYADYHRRHKGFSPALVCAAGDDTSLDQLRQSAAMAGIPFYGPGTESSNPVKVAVQGVDRFRKQDGCDLIVVDTGGRHTQEAALVEEMRQVAEATRPDLVVLVIDASIGQAAFDQALTFASVGAAAVIVTKMDAQAKGAGALSAIATTKSPVMFIGTGERVADLEAFDASSFVRRLLARETCSPTRIGLVAQPVESASLVAQSYHQT